MPKTSICVRYKCVDDWHVFQSEEVPGLYIASRDARLAFEDVAPAIKLLMKLNEGVDCEVVPEASFKEFIAAARDHEDAEQAPLVLSNKRFVLSAVAA